MSVAVLVGCGPEVATPSTSTTTPSTPTGSAGAGGSCGGACPSCTAFTPWSMALSHPGIETLPWPVGQAAAPDGSLILVTSRYSKNGDQLESVGSSLSRIDPGGNVLWEQDGDRLWGAASDGACGAFVTGGVEEGAATVLGIPVQCGAVSCTFLGRVDPSGTPLWLHVYDPGPGNYAEVSRIEAGADGHLVVAGSFCGSLDLGSGPIENPSVYPDAHFVAALSAAGEGLWSRRIETHGINLYPWGLGVAPAGDVVVASSFRGQVDFGEGPIAGPAGEGYTSSYVVAYDPAGNLRFGKVFGEDQSSGPSAWRASFDAAGDIVIAGRDSDPMDLGGGPVGVAGQLMIIVAKLDPTGDHIWSGAFPAGPAEPMWTLTPGFGIDDSGHVWLGGVSGAMLELDPSGALVATHALGGSGARYADIAGFGPGGAPLVFGTFDDTIDIGQGLLTAGGAKSTFVGVLGL